MNLMKKSIELNKIIEEVVVSIRDLNEKYLIGEIDYPYNEISSLLDKYDVKYRRLMKKKNSLINKILCKMNSKRKKMIKELKLLDKYEVHNKASVESIPLILDVYEQNKLSEESREEIKKKLFPVMNGFTLYYLVELYPKCKRCDRIQRSANGLAYLQEMFVDFIIARILNDNKRKGLNYGVVWTYQEICNNFLDEKPYKIIIINREK